MSFWTPEIVAELIRLTVDERCSAHVTAARIGTTRNAVIGKLHRLGTVRPAPVFRKIPGPQKQKPKKRIVERPVDLSGFATCQWPVNANDKPFQVCGLPAKMHKPYCPDHCAIAYVPRWSAR